MAIVEDQEKEHRRRFDHGLADMTKTAEVRLSEELNDAVVTRLLASVTSSVAHTQEPFRARRGASNIASPQQMGLHIGWTRRAAENAMS